VHGGGFTQGDKRMGASSPFYDNVGLWAARHGMIGVTINYRLAPKAQWPAAAEDVGLAVAWARKAIADFGGDPNRIFLMGHSAGATHVASYVSHRQFWTAATPSVAGAIIVSGTFEITADPVPADEKFFVDRERAYFGSDPSLQSAESSTAGVVESPVPLCIVNAQFDPPYFLRRAAGLKAAFAQAHRSDPFVVLPGENHMAEAFSMNTEDEGLSQAVARCVEEMR
jgi:acetyl esterase/lipase